MIWVLFLRYILDIIFKFLVLLFSKFMNFFVGYVQGGEDIFDESVSFS